MPRLYYQTLILGILLALLIPSSYLVYLSAQENNNPSSFTKTVYQFVNVDHPIQPLPTSIIFDEEWASVGKALFHSPLLSKDNSISCASCHMVNFGGDDGFSVSTGVNNKLGARNSPTVLNAVFNFKQFWDGRANTLAQQVEGPVHNPVEMASNWQQILTKLNKDNYFSAAFKNLGINKIAQQHVIQAITIYEESLITPNSAIDRYLHGDTSALTRQQQQGLEKFIEYGCTTCHQGRNIGGNLFQKLGQVSDIPTQLAKDTGKFQLTQDPLDKYVFKVPSLRNVAETAPYFHNGAVASLEEAVQIMAKTQLGRTLSTQDIADLVALLNSFSAPVIELPTNEVN